MKQIKEKLSFNPHFVSLCVMLGTALPSFTKFKGNTVLSFLIAFSVFAFFSFFLYLIVWAVIKKAPPMMAVTFWVLIAVYSLFVFKSAFTAFLSFAEQTVFKNKILLILLLVILFLSLLKLKNEGFLKLSLILFSVSLLILFTFFILLSKSCDFSRITSLYARDDSIAESTLTFLKETFLPMLILIPYQALTFKQLRIKAYFTGSLVSTVILFLMVAFPVFLFGAEFTSRLDFPFSTAVSTISVGRLYSRLDGFYYFFVFSGTLIKGMTALFTAGMSLCNIKKLYEQNSE